MLWFTIIVPLVEGGKGGGVIDYASRKIKQLFHNIHEKYNSISHFTENKENVLENHGSW